jgi:hypothetical protein
MGVSGNLVDASRLWNVGSSAGGVSGMEPLVAEAVASRGSSTRAKLSLLGALRFAERANGGEHG